MTARTDHRELLLDEIHDVPTDTEVGATFNHHCRLVIRFFVFLFDSLDKGEKEKQEGMSGGTVALIVIPIILAIIAVIFFLILYVKKKKRGTPGGRNITCCANCELEDFLFSATFSCNEIQKLIHNHCLVFPDCGMARAAM